MTLSLAVKRPGGGRPRHREAAPARVVRQELGQVCAWLTSLEREFPGIDLAVAWRPLSRAERSLFWRDRELGRAKAMAEVRAGRRCAIAAHRNHLAELAFRLKSAEPALGPLARKVFLADSVKERSARFAALQRAADMIRRVREIEGEVAMSTRAEDFIDRRLEEALRSDCPERDLSSFVRTINASLQPLSPRWEPPSRGKRRHKPCSPRRKGRPQPPPPEVELDEVEQQWQLVH